MKIDPRQEGYQLLQDGLAELAYIESNGIRIDMDLLASTKEDLVSRVKKLRAGLETDPVWKKWKRRYGAKSKLTSGQQLGVVLEEDLGVILKNRTLTGRAKVDEEALQGIDHPFVRDLAKMFKYNKALGTFLKGIESEIVDGFLHPSFSLHMARSFRSSSSDPNFQNFPVRDKEIAKIIRSLFIARSSKHALVENDFKGIEVALSAAYHKDPVFIDYITTPGKDMHRDMAAQIYMLKPEEVSKDARYGAKNKFVFPQFYGDFYVSCAKALWEWIRKGKLTTPEGLSLYKHLRNKGIKELGECDPEQEPRKGTFEKHLKEVEDDFWNRRFQRYGQWRKEWYRRYLDRGYFDLLTGFRVHGYYKRNSVVNYPVQGAAFHCLLWTLIQVNRRLRKHKMDSRIVGQIHDSLIGDVRVTELCDYLEIVEETTTKLLPKHWPWLVVPPQIEYEMAPPRGSWHDKQEFKFSEGKFFHPTKEGRFTTDPEVFVKTLKRKE